MRLIDADELKTAFPTCDNSKSILIASVRATINHMPTIEERKTGKWLIRAVNTFELAYGSTGYEPVYECSICGGVEESYLRLDEPIMPDDASFPNYCPNCGSYMRGDKHETD